MINIDYSDDVYKPSDDTYLILDNAECGKSVLEMGSGSGLIAITLARQGHSVTAADISPEAINLIKHNAFINNVDMEIVRSDLFENIHGKYDTIIFNPPYLPVEGESPQWAGGKDGFAVTGKFLATAHEYLNPGGNIFLILSDLTDIESFIEKNRKYEFIKLKSMSFDFEAILLYELKVRK
ncbi:MULTISPECIES: HemK2/MTQ2 family protein methyltransferase [Ferroplasma]|jgi:release factor glutamine methyltransferase|uniref:Methyltransferase n=2 Tax=Ferroplasma TaxID=74968 RepID=S0AR84_FERAC|nr:MULTISPECIES: HemK2/MTQ2 family protein methyltransferase [Ferroplasma]AGO60654.1 methyltransferase [Ferroplasma acidarmanus Fer1]ARD85410.1 methyltransferase [Ferroplasma acidiphilum]MCL4348884.1 methyltransferase [Candidatus Thermoplasmatota archaeon]